jgi:hypothetical protein
VLKDHLKKLNDLYRRTQTDWVLTVHVILTEPVCPTVIIAPEGCNAARYRVDNDSIEQGIAEAVERVHREIILGETVEPSAPYTNPDDEKLARWIATWQRGEQVDWDGETV